MKRKIRKESGLYLFLENECVLQKADETLIKDAKKKYWALYKKKWNKEKRKQCTFFDVPFSPKELKIIHTGAERSRTSPTNFIKQSALVCSSGRNIIDPVAIGEIREIVVLHHNMIRALIDENELPEEIGNKLLNQAVQIEQKALDFFHL